MTSENAKSSLNINSILLMIVVALSGWTLRTVVAQSADNAASQQRLTTYDRDLVDIRSRLLVAEKDIVEIRIHIAKESK